jgi:holo-[acyl-carrier protein] synthase
VVNIGRIASLGEGVKRRLFHPAELAEAASMESSAAVSYLSGRFASKEALGKALGCGLAALGPSTVHVGRSEDGRPYFVLTEKLTNLLAGRSILLSISHDDPVAMATVILTGGHDGPQ